jgi:hypothetical protein
MTKPAAPVNTIMHQLITKLGEEEFTLPAEQNELWAIVENSEVYACLYHIKAGLAYKALKEQLPHGEFDSELKKRGIQVRIAQQRIAVADLILNCPALNTKTSSHLLSDDSNRRTSADLEIDENITLESFSFSQLNELTRLPEEKIKSLQPEELQELSKMPVRALKTAVKQMNLDFESESKLEAQNANLKKQLEELQIQHADAINEMNREKIAKAPEKIYGLLPLVAMIRQEAPSVSQQIHEHGLTAVNLVERLIAPNLDYVQAKMAAQALYHFIAAPYKQIGLAINRLEEHFGDDLTGIDAELPTYSEAEWEEAENKRQTIILLHEDATKPRKKRGRK